MESQSVLTSSVLFMAELHPRFFFYMHPYPFYFKVDSVAKLIYFRKRPWNWKLYPWLFSMTVITGCIGVGSLLYVLTTYFLGLRKDHLSIFKIMTFLTCLVICFVEVSASCLLFWHQEVLETFDQTFILEKKCKPT